MSSYKQDIWDSFCNRNQIAETGVNLFAQTDDIVNVIEIGKKKRFVLERSQDMETLVIAEVRKVLEDYSSGEDLFEGLIYMMYQFSNNSLIPLYIG